MSLLLATALLAAPATLPSCSWDRPGVNPFVGNVVAAVDRYADIPAEVRAKLKARMAKRQYDEIATITRSAVTGKSRYEAVIRDMHFGAGQVCNTVTRDRWSEQHQERGLVYCESGHCIIVPTVCRNVSRITRLEARAEAVEAPAPVATTVAAPAQVDATPGGDITAGGDDADESPRLRSGGAFGGVAGPMAGGVADGPVGGQHAAPAGPAGFGQRLGGLIGSAVDSVIGSVAKVVRETIDAVTALPLLAGVLESSAADPARPLEPAATGERATSDPARPSVAQDEPAVPVAPAATQPQPAVPGLLKEGGHGGSAADPGPTPTMPGVVLFPAPQDSDDQVAGSPAGPGVDALVKDIETEIDAQTPPTAPGSPSAPGTPSGGSEPGDAFVGGPTGGGGQGGAIAPAPAGELPEPATPALVLLAALAALATRRGR